MPARHRSVGLALVAVLMLVAGCDAAPRGTTTQPVPTAAAGQPTAGGQSPLAGKTVRLGVWASPEELTFFEQWVKPFQDKTGIDVTIESADWTTYVTKLPAQLSAGGAADVIEMPNAIPLFGPQHVLADLTPLMQRDMISQSDYLKEPFQKFAYEGKLLSFPTGVTLQMLAYNKDIFDRAGLEYPTRDWTWSDMLETATKLTVDRNGKHPNEAGFDPSNVVQWGIELALDEEGGWAPFVFQNGGEYWKADYTEPNFTDPKVIEAWQFLADLMHKYHVAPSPAQSEEVGGSPFQSGRAAMGRFGSFMLTAMQQNITGFRWDVTVPPRGKQRGVFVDGIGWSISAASKEQEAAWELVKYFVTDGQTFMGQQHWQVPIATKAFDAWATPPPEHVAELMDEFNYGHPWPSYKNATQVAAIIEQITAQIWDGTLSPQQGAELIQQKVAPLVK